MLSLWYPLEQKGRWVGTADTEFWVEEVPEWHPLARCLNWLHETKTCSPWCECSVLLFYLTAESPICLLCTLFPTVWTDEPLLSIQVFPLSPPLPQHCILLFQRERYQGTPFKSSRESDPFLKRGREEGREGNHLALLHTNPCYQYYTLILVQNPEPNPVPAAGHWRDLHDILPTFCSGCLVSMIICL